ncbi:putative glycerol kinase 5 isoform X2 [Belonocnema kinseyi]|nr:putative glycerol kinase 5 isoform X2 [Belonocnema kinseyi]XP_033228078.1 putative glycerol kinase 5 isoform X2 [Belonocnema kinseyi]
MKYVAALDVGTTTVRCHILDENAVTIVSSAEKVELLYPKSGYVEIDPDDLWTTICKVCKYCIQESGIDPKLISCLGISSQRGTFLTWDLETGKHYHKFITWKDLRADTMVKEWNSSFTMKTLRAGSNALYAFFRSKRFLAGSVLKLMNTQTTLRLLWAVQNVPGLQEAAIRGKAVYGGVDCWLLYKLTGKHVTDVSSASATGLFDPFTMEWAGWALGIFKLPRSLFPEVRDTAGNFGTVPKDLFGAEIPIFCSMADQAASLYGSGCFKPGDLKVTMGTGSFLNVNTGQEPHASVTGLYPLVGWRLGSELVYVVEGASNDTGSLIEWAKFLGIINQFSETSDLANSVEDSNGVYFVPAFSGLQAPINDPLAAAGFLGLKPTSGKAHLTRSLLESLVFRILLLYKALLNETRFSYQRIR